MVTKKHCTIQIEVGGCPSFEFHRNSETHVCIQPNKEFVLKILNHSRSNPIGVRFSIDQENLGIVQFVDSGTKAIVKGRRVDFSSVRQFTFPQSACGEIKASFFVAVRRKEPYKPEWRSDSDTPNDRPVDMDPHSENNDSTFPTMEIGNRNYNNNNNNNNNNSGNNMNNSNYHFGKVINDSNPHLCHFDVTTTQITSIVIHYSTAERLRKMGIFMENPEQWREHANKGVSYLFGQEPKITPFFEYGHLNECVPATPQILDEITRTMFDPALSLAHYLADMRVQDNLKELQMRIERDYELQVASEPCVALAALARHIYGTMEMETILDSPITTELNQNKGLYIPFMVPGHQVSVESMMCQASMPCFYDDSLQQQQQQYQQKNGNPSGYRAFDLRCDGEFAPNSHVWAGLIRAAARVLQCNIIVFLPSPIYSNKQGRTVSSLLFEFEGTVFPGKAFALGFVHSNFLVSVAPQGQTHWINTQVNSNGIEPMQILDIAEQLCSNEYSEGFIDYDS